MAVTLQGRIALDWSSVDRGMRAVQTRLKTFAAVTGGGLYSAAASLARFGALWGTVGAGIAAWGLKRAGDFELLKMRLETAMGDAARARQAWEETVELAIKSPLELEPLVRARVMLANFGLTGKEALASVANAAVMTQRQVEDVTSAIGSLETEPLRRMGITSRSRSVRTPTGEETRFKFGFRDREKVYREIKVVGIEEARKAVLSIFDVKYSGGLDRMARTWVGVWSTFRDAGKQAFAQVSDALRVQLIPHLWKLNEWLLKGVETGTFMRWGQWFYGWVGNVLRSITALAQAWSGLSQATHRELQNVLLTCAAFGVAWYTGFVQTIIKSLGYLVVTQRWAFTSMTLVMAAFAGGLVGYKIGEALERAFELSTPVAKFMATIKAVHDSLADWFGAILALGQAWVAGMKAVLSLDGAGIADARARLASVASAFGAIFDPRTWKARRKALAETFADIDAVSPKAPEAPDGGPWQTFFAELKREFATLQGWLDDFGGLVPDSIKRLLEDFKTKLTALPDLQLSTGSLGFADDMERAEEAAAELARLMAPLRGFGTGALGVRGVMLPAPGAEAEPVAPEPEKEAPQTDNPYDPGPWKLPIPEPGTGWGTIKPEDWETPLPQVPAAPIPTAAAVQPAVPAAPFVPGPLAPVMIDSLDGEPPPERYHGSGPASYGLGGAEASLQMPSVPKSRGVLGSLWDAIGNWGMPVEPPIPTLRPSSAVAPLWQDRNARPGAAAGALGDSGDVGQVVDQQEITNRLLGQILASRSTVSFA